MCKWGTFEARNTGKMSYRVCVYGVCTYGCGEGLRGQLKRLLGIVRLFCMDMCVPEKETFMSSGFVA